jgi:hypothetical protein
LRPSGMECPGLERTRHQILYRQARRKAPERLVAVQGGGNSGNAVIAVIAVIAGNAGNVNGARF